MHCAIPTSTTCTERPVLSEVEGSRSIRFVRLSFNVDARPTYWILLILTISLFTKCEPNASQDNRPNIVLILVDDMGFSDLGCYGGEINTPNIDALAYEGLRFTNFYNTGRCCPTRASLLTGLYPHQAGVGRMVYNNYGGAYQGFLNNQAVTLAEVLGPAGYKTMMSGKWHVGHQPGQWPTDRGFERFYGIHIHVDSYYKVLKGCDVYLDGELLIPETDDPVNHLFPENDWYTTDVFTDYAIQFLNEESKDSDQPFFLYVAHNAPHFPIEAPDEDVAKYEGQYLDGWDELREEKFERMKEMGIIPIHSVLSPTENTLWNDLDDADKKELDFRRAIYSAQIDRLDQNVGRLVEHLKKIGKYENTLILFMSDNGCSNETGQFGMNWETHKIDNYEEWKEEGGWSVSQGQAWANYSNVPFRLYKKYNHQGGIATPLIAQWPGKIENGGGYENRVGHVIDIMATLEDIAQANYPSGYNGFDIKPKEGKSLIPYLTGEEREEHQYIYWEHEGNRAVRQGNWKLVAESEKDWELYNLEEDPTELNNLIDINPDKAEQLRKAYTEWAQKNDVRDWPLEKSQ